jgi:hypothetical protein
MKKRFAGLVFLAFISSSIFAEIDVNVMFGQIQFNAFDAYNDGGDGSETKFGTGVRGLGPTGSSFIGMGFSASTDVLGIQADIDAGSNGVELGNNLKVWWKPVKWTTLTIGKYWEDELRGTNDDGIAFVFSQKPFDVGVFDRFSNPGPDGVNADVMGVHLALKPVNGLYLGASIPTATISNWEIGPEIGDIEKAYKNGQYAVGYMIRSIGLLRAQYFASDAEKEKAQAAFKLDNGIVKGLSLDFGVTIPIGKNEKVSDDDSGGGSLPLLNGGSLPPLEGDSGDLSIVLPGYHTKLAAFIGYNAGVWKLDTYTTATFAKDNVYTFDVVPAFPRGNWTFGADLGFKSEKDATKVSGAGWLSIKILGAIVKTGIGVTYGLDKKDYGLSIPIQISFGELFGLAGSGGPSLPPLPSGELPPGGLPPIGN